MTKPDAKGESVKRYTLTHEDGFAGMDERPNGNWVKAKDYEALLAQNAALKDEVEANTRCPYIATSDEGTSYCQLGETQATAEVLPLNARIRELEASVLSLTQRAEAAEAEVQQFKDYLNCNSIDEHRTAIAKIASEILVEAKSEVALEQQIASLQSSLSAAQREREELQATLDGIKNRVESLQSRSTRTAFGELQEAVGYHAQMAYEKAKWASDAETRIKELQSEIEHLKTGDGVADVIGEALKLIGYQYCSWATDEDGYSHRYDFTTPEGYTIRLHEYQDTIIGLDCEPAPAATLADRDTAIKFATEVFNKYKYIPDYKSPNWEEMWLSVHFDIAKQAAEYLVSAGLVERHPTEPYFRWIASTKGESE